MVVDYRTLAIFLHELMTLDYCTLIMSLQILTMMALYYKYVLHIHKTLGYPTSAVFFISLRCWTIKYPGYPDNSVLRHTHAHTRICLDAHTPSDTVQPQVSVVHLITHFSRDNFPSNGQAQMSSIFPYLCEFLLGDIANARCSWYSYLDCVPPSIVFQIQ